jgi:hypothetical protein
MRRHRNVGASAIVAMRRAGGNLVAVEGKSGQVAPGFRFDA